MQIFKIFIFNFIKERRAILNENDLLETLKITIELVRKLNNEKRDYIKNIVKICIALIISFTIIICCFYILYFTM